VILYMWIPAFAGMTFFYNVYFSFVTHNSSLITKNEIPRRSCRLCRNDSINPS